MSPESTERVRVSRRDFIKTSAVGMASVLAANNVMFAAAGQK